MEKFLSLIQNTIWYRQFLYGLVLALLFGFTTLLSGFNPIWAIAQVLLVSSIREHYLQDITGTFNWRNFFFVLVPVVLLHIFFF